MIVFHVLGYLASRYGGPPKVALSLGQTMKKYDISSYFWATATDEEKKVFTCSDDKVCLFPSRFPHSWYRSPELTHELAKRIDEADILHLHQVWDYPLWRAARLARKRGKPYVVTPHGIFSQSWRFKSLKKRIYMNIIARSLLNAAAAVHAIVPPEVHGFEKAGIQSPYTVIPNGIDPEEFNKLSHRDDVVKKWPLLNGRKVVLFLGRLSAEKGLDTLIHSWKSVIKKKSHALLVIAGPDYKGYSVTVKKLVKEEGLKNNVFFTGHIEGEEIKSLLDCTHLFVLPSYSEGFSMVILEALASGKPCIITKRCNFPEVQDVGAGYVIRHADKEDLSSAIIKMLSLSDRQRQDMGECGRQLVMNHYTQDMMARKMLNVYQCILSNKPVPLYPDQLFVNNL